ncbi:MAG: TonB C-terminal domain-containing protein [Verrucomicrobiia bacterium]|jgi:outer membrane biosynthesis protein TonB
MSVYDEDEPRVFQPYHVIIGGAFIVAIAITVWFVQKRLTRTSTSRLDQRLIVVNLPPPPVTPPPPPARPQLADIPSESEQKMISQEPVTEVESRPDAAAKSEAPSGESPGPGTSIQGDGSSDGFGLRAGNGLGFGTGGTGNTIGGAGRSRWGWYAGQVQSAISQALQSDKTTRDADFRVEAQIWADRTGRITRARIARSTGHAALDQALTNDILVGLVLQEPPPDGMPMPIVLRLTARHPNVALSTVNP